MNIPKTEEVSGEIADSAPPPYSPVASAPFLSDNPRYLYGPSAPVGSNQVTYGAIAPIPVPMVVISHGRFIFKQTESKGGSRCPLMDQIIDSCGHPIMSVVVDPETGVHARQDSDENTPKIIYFTDASGHKVMTAMKTADSWEVTSGDRMLGVVKERSRVSFSPVVPKNLSGLPICQVQQCGATFLFLDSHGLKLGECGWTSFGTFETELSQTLDANKAILLVTAYLIYLLHRARTPVGETATLKLGPAARALWPYVCVVIIFLTFIGTAVSIFMIFRRNTENHHHHHFHTNFHGRHSTHGNS